MKFLLSLSLKVKIIIAACAVAAAAAVGAAIVLNSEEAYRVIKVFELNGKAAVTRENTGDIDAYEGMNLESGDVLSVEENSTLRVSLDSDKYILLDGGTVLELTASGTPSDSRTVINLKTGTILNEIKNPLSANSSYEVNTPKATMAVRGTTFTVTTVQNPDGSYITDLYTEEGIVSVRLFDENGFPKGDETLVPAGGTVTVLTEVNSETGNSAAVDGDPHFVFRTDGGLEYCGDSDPVYFPGSKASAEAQTEQTASEVVTDTEMTETDSSFSETETDSSVYEADLNVTDIPIETTVPAESSETAPVIPGEISSAPETSAAETTVPTVSESTVTSASKTKKTETERTTAAAAEKTEAATTSAAAETTAETRPFYPLPMPPIYNPPITAPAPPVTTLPTETSIPADTTLPAGTTVPMDTTVPQPESSETETAASEEPTIHRVNFIDGNGNVISAAEFGDSETLGTLPPIADKKGYTGKWVSGGVEVTENTVISSDMDITAEYTPRPVTVKVLAPHSGDPLNTYDVVLTFTVAYDGALADNSDGYNIAALTQYIENLYADYFAEHGKVSELKSITFSGNAAAAADSSVIAGDNVYEDGGNLCVNISFNYDRV